MGKIGRCAQHHLDLIDQPNHLGDWLADLQSWTLLDRFKFQLSKGLRMPIYAYRCESCGHAQDSLQKMSDPVLIQCSSCGAMSLKKQVTAAGFQLKGTGWYVTDFRGGNSAPAADPVESAAPKGDAVPAASTPSTPSTPSVDASPAVPTQPSAIVPSTASPSTVPKSTAKPAGIE